MCHLCASECSMSKTCDLHFINGSPHAKQIQTRATEHTRTHKRHSYTSKHLTCPPYLPPWLGKLLCSRGLSRSRSSQRAGRTLSCCTSSNLHPHTHSSSSSSSNSSRSRSSSSGSSSSSSSSGSSSSSNSSSSSRSGSSSSSSGSSSSSSGSTRV